MTYRKTIVEMLNILGDRERDTECNKDGCEGCEVDAQMAMQSGLQALGYETWRAFHEEEIMNANSG